MTTRRGAVFVAAMVLAMEALRVYVAQPQPRHEQPPNIRQQPQQPSFSAPDRTHSGAKPCPAAARNVGKLRAESERMQAEIAGLKAGATARNMELHRLYNHHRLNAAPLASLPDSEMLPIQTSTVVFILSARRNFEIRSAIRDTWANGQANVFFVVGSACTVPPLDRRSEFQLDPTEPYVEGRGGMHPSTWKCVRAQGSQLSERDIKEQWMRQLEWNRTVAEETAQLLKERDYYADLLELPVDDGYSSLPDKVKGMYTWGTTHTRADWFTKVDDDCFVRVEALDNYLVSSFSPEHRTVICIPRDNIEAPAY